MIQPFIITVSPLSIAQYGTILPAKNEPPIGHLNFCRQSLAADWLVALLNCLSGRLRRKFETMPPKIEQIEFGRYAEGFIPEPFFERATRELLNYFVPFSVEDRPSGSATLVESDGQYGFLTAAHALDTGLNQRSVTSL